MNNTDSGKVYGQYVRMAFRMMVAALVIVTVAVAVEVFFAARAGMALSACLVSLGLGVLLGAGLDVLRGKRRRHADR